MHRKNVINNLILPDLKLLEESKNRIDNFKQFITVQMEVVYKLQNYIDKLWLKRANIIETVQRHLNNNQISEEQVIASLPKKSKILYTEYSNKIKNTKEEIETKYNNIANYKINILIPKHSGKPITGNIVYPSGTLKDTEILKKAKLKTSLTDKFNINDAKLICNADAYKSSAEILNEVTELKTPITVNTTNLKNIEEFINNEIEYHKNRLVEIETEQIYKSKVSIIESPKEEKIQQKDIKNVQSNTINQQKDSIIHHRRIVDTIKYIGQKTDTFLVEKDCTETNLGIMYLRMPKQFLQKDELKNYKTIKVQTIMYDFTEFDKLQEEKYKRMQYIDPKFYRQGQSCLNVYNNTIKQEEEIQIHNFPVYKYVHKENKKQRHKYHYAYLSKGCSY